MHTSNLLLIVEYKWQTFDAIYYEYGSLVITYHSRDKAIKVFQLLQSASFDDKQLYVMLLPNIQVSWSAQGQTYLS